MPIPRGPVQAGVNGENSYLHVITDNTSEQPTANFSTTQAAPIPMGSFQEMLLGHRSGGTLKAAPVDFDGSYLGSSNNAAITYGANTLTDTRQNWVVNAHAGRLCGVYDTTTKTFQWDIVTSNTATALTMKSNWAAQPANNSLYFMVTPADQNQGASVSYAAGPTNALVDTGKAWTINMWRGQMVLVSAQIRYVVSNTATQLTLDAAWATTPSAQQAYGLSKDTYMDWNVTQRGDTGGFNLQGNNTNPDNY